jgi:Transmembrane domain of unknown function (DUF3566)
MAEPGPRQPSRQGSGRPPPQPGNAASGTSPPTWEQPTVSPPRYATSPGTSYYPPDAPVRPAQGRTATRPPVTPPAQRPRPPAGPVRRDGPTADGAAAAALAAPGKRKQPIVRGVRSRRLVRRLDIWSVFRVSVVFYACVFIVMIIAGIALWNVAAAFGVITDGEKLVRSLFALTTFTLHPITALLWGAVIAGAICFLGVLFNVFAAVVYNLISDVAGGVQVVVIGDQGQEDSV